MEVHETGAEDKVLPRINKNGITVKSSKCKLGYDVTEPDSSTRDENGCRGTLVGQKIKQHQQTKEERHASTDPSTTGTPTAIPATQAAIPATP